MTSPAPVWPSTLVPAEDLLEALSSLSPMKILFLTYISPQQQWGSAHRSRLIIEGLARRGSVDVLVLSFGSPAEQRGTCLETPTEYGRIITMHVKSRGLRARPRFDVSSRSVTGEVERHVDLRSYDLFVSRYVRPALKLKLPRETPLIVDFDDALYRPPWAALRGVKNRIGAILRLVNDRLLVPFRLRSSRMRSRHFLFCRQAEIDAYPALDSSLVPNIPSRPRNAELPTFTSPPAPTLTFLGLLDYMPNEDAVDWFLGAIWPRVLAQVPEARFLLAGTASADRAARWSKHDRVDVLGFVQDLSELYARTTAAVVPMRSGAGTNIKALEPFLYGRPVVATSLVLDGYRPVVSLEDVVLTADDAMAFAEHCVTLLRQPARARALAERGHERIAPLLNPATFSGAVIRAVDRVMDGVTVARRSTGTR